jgi:Tfp pilus assembly protein PilV
VRSQPGAENGFTLVELLMVVLMTGIIITALASAFTVGLQNTSATGTRLSESGDLQLLSAYFPSDAQNAGPLPADVTTTASATAGCTGSLLGGNVLALRWQDGQTLAEYGVTYRTARVGGEEQLLRYACSGGTTTSIVIARSLRATAGAVATISQAPRMTMTLTLASGFTAGVTAVRRSIPGVAAAASPAPPVCALTSAALSPSTAETTPVGLLLVVPVLTVTVTGPCGTLSVQYSPGGGSTRSQPLTGGGTRSAMLTNNGWTAGDRQLSILDGSTALGSVPFTVTNAPACTAVLASVSPSAGVRSANPAPNTLTAPGTVTVTATFASSCGVAALVYDAVSAASAPSASTSAFVGSGPSRSAVVPATTAWSDGPHTLLIKEGAELLTQATFTVTPAACSVASIALSRSSVNENNGDINQNVDVQVNTTGVCSGLRISFVPGTAPALRNLTETYAGSSVWQGTIPKNTYTWTRGTKRITPQLSDGTSLSPTADLQVN